MPVVRSYRPGMFSFADLGTTDVEGAKQFYGKVFGWDAEDMDGGEGMVYTMFSNKGKTVAGCYRQPDEVKEQGFPPGWMDYFTVAEVRESVGPLRSIPRWAGTSSSRSKVGGLTG